MTGSSKGASGPPLATTIERFRGPRSDAWALTDRAAQMSREGREIIHLSVGDPDLDTPKPIIDTAVAAMRAGRTHYTPMAGESDLLEAIAKTATTRYEQSIDAAQVCVFPGAQCALFAALLVLTGPDDEVVLLEPFYATYEGVARAGGASIVSVALDPGDGFALDIDRLRAAISKKTRVIIANSPGNPAGNILSAGDWQSLVDLCVAEDIWLISDEVYCDLVFDGEHQSPVSSTNSSDHVIVINSVSKSYAMTGWRLGWTIAPPRVAAEIANLAQFLLFGVSQFTQDAVSFALQECDNEISAIRDEFRKRRDLLCDRLEKIDGLVLSRPAGGMFVMTDVSALGCDGLTFATELLETQGVDVVPGFAFGDSVKDFVRIGYLLDPELIKKAADKIEGFVGGRLS